MQILSQCSFNRKKGIVYLSLAEGYCLKQETMRAFEAIFPSLQFSKNNNKYQEANDKLLQESSNPLYL